MYKILPILLFAFLLPNENHKDERILNYVTKIEILKNGDLDIIEEITIIAKGKKIKRGIVREFPIKYKDEYGNEINIDILIDEISRNDFPEYHLLVEETNDLRRIYIGHEDVLLPHGEHTYTLKYKLPKMVGFFSDFDEIYYDAIGTGWTLPIDKAKIYVTLPENIKIIKSIAYTGKHGKNDNNYSIKMMNNKVRIDNIHPLAPNEGMIIAVSWPKGFIVGSENYKQTKNTVSLSRDDIYDDSWAVIIGIDKYENLSNLDYAVADAEAVKDMLINKFDYPKENVKLLLNEEANKTNIVDVISDVSLKAGENDRILVFYAGHGETMPLPEGGEMGYLVPIDGNQDNLFASAIPMDDLKRLSNMSKAKHMLFLVDACYGGLAAVGSRGLEPAKTPNYIEKITNIKSRQIITAGGKDEKVFEKSEWGHSAYTKNLLSALEDGLADSNGDGYITADELGDYLSEKVSIDSENLQTPQSRRLTSHEGEFIFIANDMQINVINTVERNEEHPKKFDEVLLNNETHDEGINIFGLGLFSGSDKKIINEKVKGGLLVSIFGNAKLNLVEAKLNQDKNIINIIVLFGGCTILVPSEMYVDTQVLPIFGSFKNRNDYIIEDSNQTNKKLIVRGVAIFGGGSVRNEKWYDNMGNWQ